MLLSNLDLLATAPGGVARLRELILTLAVQGKLVPQDLEDEPASVLLQRIRTEKDRLIAYGKIKRDKPLAKMAEEEKPFELPMGWEWVHCSDYFVELCTGPFGSVIHQEDYVTNGVPLINPSHMVGGRIVHDPGVTLSQSDAERLSAYMLSAGDIVLARRGEVGRYALVTEREHGWLCGTGSFYLRLLPECNRSYLALVFSDSRFRRHLQGESVGTTMTNLNQRILLEAPIAVPPIAEQSRIVTRVEELMRLCDALEAKGQLEATQHAQLVSTLLGTLTASTTPEELADNWQRVAQHFDLLLDRPEAIDALEQTLLQLAVRGLLVPQDPTDEPASVLLTRIRAEKSRLIAEGKIKRDKPLSPISEGEKPFELPVGWEWTRLGDIWLSSFYGPRFSSDDYVTEGGVPTIRTTDMTGGRIVLKSPPLVRVPLHKFEMYSIKKGDLLVTRSGSIGVMAVFDLGIDAVPSAYLIRLRLSEFLLTDYCFIYFMSALGQIQLGLNTTAVGVPNVSASKMAEFTFPLPPFAEQSRIVTRVVALRRMCADLRQRLADGQAIQSQLAQSLVDFGY